MLFNPGVAPTAAVITKNVGEAIVKLICSEGSDLDKMMEATGLAADGPLGKIEYFFQDHCAVMRGGDTCRTRPGRVIDDVVLTPCPQWSVPAALS